MVIGNFYAEMNLALAYLGNGSILPSPSLLLLILIQNPSKNKANIPGLMSGLPLGEREKAKEKNIFYLMYRSLASPASVNAFRSASFYLISINIIITSINHNRVVKEKEKKWKRLFKESNSSIH